MVIGKCVGIQKRKLLETLEAQYVTMQELKSAAQYADFGVNGHLSRVQSICWILCYYARTSVYKKQISANDAIMISLASALHDIGKIGVPSRILYKTGILTSDEMQEMQKHVTFGVKMIDDLIEKLPYREYLGVARELTAYHHEKWDGTGYPYGLAREEIPLSARICAIADVYDALRERRPYKPAFSHEKAVEIIASGRGTHFDPQLIDVFLGCHRKIKAALEQKNEIDLTEIMVM